MSNTHVARISGIDPHVLQLLQHNNLPTAKDVLHSSVVDLIELLNITQTQALTLTQTVSAHICPAYTSVRGIARVWYIRN